MATEIIEGSIVATEPVRCKRGYCLFDPLTITDTSGTARSFRKISAGGAIGEAIRRGAAGRFYVGKNAGMAGVHGLRLSDGTAIYAKYSNIETILLVGALAGAFMLVIRFISPDSFMITPVVIGAALAIGWFLVRTGRIADRMAFESDAQGG